MPPPRSEENEHCTSEYGRKAKKWTAICLTNYYGWALRTSGATSWRRITTSLQPMMTHTTISLPWGTWSLVSPQKCAGKGWTTAPAQMQPSPKIKNSSGGVGRWWDATAFAPHNAFYAVLLTTYHKVFPFPHNHVIKDRVITILVLETCRTSSLVSFRGGRAVNKEGYYVPQVQGTLAPKKKYNRRQLRLCQRDLPTTHTLSGLFSKYIFLKTLVLGNGISLELSGEFGHRLCYADCRNSSGVKTDCFLPSDRCRMPDWTSFSYISECF